MRVASLPLAALNRRLNSVAHIHLLVTPTQFVCWWWGVLVLELLCATFLLVIGFVHIYISRDAVYHNVWLLRVPQPMLRLAGVSFTLVAIPHFVAIFGDVRHSVACRRLTFRTEARIDSKLAAPESCVPGEPLDANFIRAAPRQWRLVQFTDAVRRQWHRYFDASGEFFEIGFCVRQCVEIASQTYQAYLFSWSVPVLQLNHVLVVLLVINCVYAPILARLLKHKLGLYRAAVVGVDLVIDVAVSVVIPLWILVPHLLEFDWANSKYSDELRFDDLWFTRTISEVRQIMVTSPLDFVSSLVPHVAAIEGLSSLKAVLLRVKNESMMADVSVQTIDKARIRSGPTVLKPKPRLVRFVDAGMILWALGVSACQIQAKMRPSNRATAICQLPMMPWFAHNMSCAIIDINCHRNSIRGSRDDITSLLATVDRESLMKLHFSHCPELQLPPRITDFAYLQSIQTLNCTISDWSERAAITKRNHLRMAEVYLYNTNLTEFPRALLHGDLPTRLSFVLHTSNLTSLPHDFGEASKDHEWPNFFIEHVPLTSLPASLHNVTILSLTLFDTQIATISDDLFHSQSFNRLRLSQNRLLSTIPRNIGSLSNLAVLYAEHTNVSELPPWFESWHLATRDPVDPTRTTVSVSFYGSPICTQSPPAIPKELCESVLSVESEDHRYAVVQSLRPV